MVLLQSAPIPRSISVDANFHLGVEFAFVPLLHLCIPLMRLSLFANRYGQAVLSTCHEPLWRWSKKKGTLSAVAVILYRSWWRKLFSPSELVRHACCSAKSNGVWYMLLNIYRILPLSAVIAGVLMEWWSDMNTLRHQSVQSLKVSRWLPFHRRIILITVFYIGLYLSDKCKPELNSDADMNERAHCHHIMIHALRLLWGVRGRLISHCIILEAFKPGNPKSSPKKTMPHWAPYIKKYMICRWLWLDELDLPMQNVNRGLP